LLSVVVQLLPFFGCVPPFPLGLVSFISGLLSFLSGLLSFLSGLSLLFWIAHGSTSVF
jgi:hypothetical protein